MEAGHSRRVEILIASAQTVTTDHVTGGLRAFFAPAARPMVSGPFSPRDLALQLLKSQPGLFRWQPSLADLQDTPTITGENLSSVRFRQTFKGTPVDGGEVVVNLSTDGRLQSLYSQYRYDIPATLDPTAIRFDQSHARAMVERLSHGAPERAVGQARLLVYQHPRDGLPPLRRARRRGRARNRFLDAVRKERARARRHKLAPVGGQYYLAWEIFLVARRPLQRWRVLVDAVSGHLLRVQDVLVYASPDGTGRVFDPNPIVTSGDGSLAWSDLGASSTNARRGVIEAQLADVPLKRLAAPETPKKYRLHGRYVWMAERDDPQFAEPVQKTRRFVFSAKSRKFLDVMAYYHVDRFQDYVETALGLSDLTGFIATIDPQGYGGDDQSVGSMDSIILGEGTSPNAPDANDATIILHEFGHALQDKALPGSPWSTSSSGVPEGFADFLSAVYYDDKHADPHATRGLWGLWGKSPAMQRSCRGTTRFDDPGWPSWDAYQRGEVWAAALFEIYRKLGGDSQQAAVKGAARDLIIRLHLMANHGVPQQGGTDVPGLADTATLMAQQILASDGNLGGWRNGAGNPRYANRLHEKVIYDAFSLRALPGFPARALDVYVNDGRQGGYGSPKPNPTFDDPLWMDNHGDPPGVWLETPAVSGGPPGATSAKIGVLAQVFAKVVNRGNSGSGPITVKALVAPPGSARVWPVDWTTVGVVPTSLAVPDVPASPSPGVLVGPFSWTPNQVGAWSLLVIVECAQDQAVTEYLEAADRVPIMDLVPFDNNIAMREIAVTS